MKLVTSKVILSMIEEKDLEEINKYTTDYSALNPFFTSKVRSKSYWNERFSKTGLWDDNYGVFKIIDPEDNQISGVTWFFKPPSQHSQLEFYEVAFNIFRSDKRKKGFAAESLKIVASYLFETYPIQRVQSTTMIDINDDSISKITQSTGFKFEGTMRKCIFIRGKYIDIQLFSILRDECASLENLLI